MRNISLAVVAHISPKPISKAELYRNTVQIGVDRFRAADWSLIRRRAKNKDDAALPKTTDQNGTKSEPSPRRKNISCLTRPRVVG